MLSVNSNQDVSGALFSLVVKRDYVCKDRLSL